MSQVSNSIDSLRQWFRQCPLLSKSNRFGADYLGENPTEYAIYASPSTLKYRENILGESVLEDKQTQNYIFATRENYGSDVKQNSNNLAFFTGLIAWMIEQNNARNFPCMEEGRVTAIVPTLTAYPAQVGSDSAKYQIQIQITYRRN